MERPRTPGDLLGRTIKDDQGRTYTYAKFFRIGGASARKQVQQEGERRKANGEIRNYRTRTYHDIRIARPDGAGYDRRTIHALYTR